MIHNIKMYVILLYILYCILTYIAVVVARADAEAHGVTIQLVSGTSCLLIRFI